MRALKPRLLYLVSEDWYFLSHRLPMARAASAKGFEIHVATRVTHNGSAITAEGFQLHPLKWQRGSTNPLKFISAVAEIRRCYRRLAPDLVHQVALWPSIIGSLAATGLPFKRISAIAGLGFAFTSDSVRARTVRVVLRPLLRVLFNGAQSAVLVQNPDDLEMMRGIGIDRSKLFIIPGSGVDVNALRPLPEPEGTFTIAFVGRLLDDKGLRTLIKAHAILRERNLPVRLLVAGDADLPNPASIREEEIDAWRQQEEIEVLGHVSGIHDIWARAHVAVLPSRREGLPKSLLEAAAFGRPIVSTDVPGSREIARHGVSALLVPVDDPVALAEAIACLANDRELRLRLGAAARGLVEQEFSSVRIGAKTSTLYRQLLDLPPNQDALALP